MKIVGLDSYNHETPTLVISVLHIEDNHFQTMTMPYQHVESIVPKTLEKFQWDRTEDCLVIENKERDSSYDPDKPLTGGTLYFNHMLTRENIINVGNWLSKSKINRLAPYHLLKSDILTTLNIATEDKYFQRYLTRINHLGITCKYAKTEYETEIFKRCAANLYGMSIALYHHLADVEKLHQKQAAENAYQQAINIADEMEAAAAADAAAESLTEMIREDLSSNA